MNAYAITALGWVATATFVASYFLARPRALRTAQILGALLWVLYGILISAPPVVVANALVIGAAAWTAFRPLTDLPRQRNQ
jgi:hypothetical protein